MTGHNTATELEPIAPGETIRALRKRLGLTLGDVSNRTGLSVSTLSKLEKGHATLSYEKLHIISRGLGVDVAQILVPSERNATAMTGMPRDPLPRLGGMQAMGRRTVHRRGEAQTPDQGAAGQTYLATELLNKHMTPVITEVRARTMEEFVAEHGGLIYLRGEAFGYVLQGQIEFHTDMYAPTLLQAGDSVYFDNEMGHAFLAVGDGPCLVLTVTEALDEPHITSLQPQ